MGSFSLVWSHLVFGLVCTSLSSGEPSPYLLIFLSPLRFSQNAADMPETITSRDAARFPIIASCTLFGLYLFFKVSRRLLPRGELRRCISSDEACFWCWTCAVTQVFSQEYINLLLSVYFFVLGILALSHTMRYVRERECVCEWIALV